MDASIRSASGITIHTTERGLPVQITLEERALAGTPAELADEILQLCQMAARRAQAARRQELSANGHSVGTLRRLNLDAATAGESPQPRYGAADGDGLDVTRR